MVDADEVQHFALSLGKSAVGMALTLDCRSVLIIGCVLKWATWAVSNLGARLT